jgi:hypothetical protein
MKQRCLSYLKGLPDRDTKCVHIRGWPMSVNDMMDEVIKDTDIGQEIVELFERMLLKS